METNNNALINSMVEMLEVITDSTINLDKELGATADFSNYLKTKVKTEMGGHIPQKDNVSGVEYCVKPNIVMKVIESV